MVDDTTTLRSAVPMGLAVPTTTTLSAMAEIIKHYFNDGWRSRAISCPCGWEGSSTSMKMELHDEVTDYACPHCEALLMIVSHPNLDQVRAAAAQGHAEAREQLTIIEEALSLPANKRQ